MHLLGHEVDLCVYLLRNVAWEGYLCVFLLRRASDEAYLYVYLFTKIACEANLYVFLLRTAMARDPFFGLERISGFWNLQKAVLKHFWLLAQNHCQNGSKVWRASYFSAWSEYLLVGTLRTLF